MKTKPSKPRKVAKLRVTLTRRANSPFPDSVENIVKLRQWARRAPLHAVLDVSKRCDVPGVYVLSLNVMGYGRKIANTRASFTDRTFTGRSVSEDGIRSMGVYARGKMIRRMRRELGQPFATFRDETPWGSEDV